MIYCGSSVKVLQHNTTDWWILAAVRLFAVGHHRSTNLLSFASGYLQHQTAHNCRGLWIEREHNADSFHHASWISGLISMGEKCFVCLWGAGEIGFCVLFHLVNVVKALMIIWRLWTCWCCFKMIKNTTAWSLSPPRWVGQAFPFSAIH